VVGSTAYVVGGYTGTVSLDTIVAYTPGSTAKVVGHLPIPVRYAAVAAFGGKVIVAGGTSGTASTAAIFSFDPASGHTTPLGTLPHVLTHSAAVTVGRHVDLIGGRAYGPGAASRSILSVNPLTGKVTTGGRLPRALSDVAALTAGGTVLVAGGRDKLGRASDRIYEMRPS
jgi:N-acetylneuraminic acid mutarotase